MSHAVKSAVFALAMSALLGVSHADGAVVFSEDFSSFGDGSALTGGANPNGWVASSSISFDKAFEAPSTLTAGAGDLVGPGFAFDVGGMRYYPYTASPALKWYAAEANFAGGAVSSGPMKLSFDIDPFNTLELGVILRDPVSNTQVYAINDYSGMDLGVDNDSQAWVGDYGVANPGGDGRRFGVEVNIDLTANTVSMTVESLTDPVGFAPDPVTTGTFAIAPNFNPSQIILFGRHVGGAGPSNLDNIVVDAIPEPASLSLLGLGALALRRRRV